jgi:hypothetical protein
MDCVGFFLDPPADDGGGFARGRRVQNQLAIVLIIWRTFSLTLLRRLLKKYT